MRAIDLYSGIGGWALGLRLAGIEVVASYEWWDKAARTRRLRIKTFELEPEGGYFQISDVDAQCVDGQAQITVRAIDEFGEELATKQIEVMTYCPDVPIKALSSTDRWLVTGNFGQLDALEAPMESRSSLSTPSATPLFSSVL
jgi:hypothetical protein